MQHQDVSPTPEITISEFFKSHNADCSRSEKKYDGSEMTNQTRASVIQKAPKSSSKKIDQIPEAKELPFTPLEPTRDPSRPRIILRICNGRSTFVNEPNSNQKLPQAIEVPEINDQITATKITKKRNLEIKHYEPETEISPSIPKKRRKNKAKFTIPALKSNKSKHTAQNDDTLKYVINKKESTNMNIDKSEAEKLENDRKMLLAILEGSDYSDTEMDVPVDNKEKKPDATEDLPKQHNSKLENKKNDVKVQSKISSLTHQSVFVETAPIKITDTKVELGQPAKKGGFKSGDKIKKMLLNKHSLLEKEKKIDEEKKKESIPNKSPSNSFHKQSDDNFDSITSVKCDKREKKFYMAVQNNKKAQLVQNNKADHLVQKFNDYVKFILDVLQPKNSIETRCVFAIDLATKCMIPAFRMHLKHGTVAKIFHALQDATKNQSLGMCTATVMFVLSQYRLNMDLDRGCLELMLNLLQNDKSHDQALDRFSLTDHQFQNTRKKVLRLCLEIQSQGGVKLLNTDDITVEQLAMEALLSLNCARAGEWFKEDMRQLGGLDHILCTVVQCCNHVDPNIKFWSPTLLNRIKKVVRCLRILENVTIQNEKNIAYLLGFENGILGVTLVRMFKVCDHELMVYLYPRDDENHKDSVGAVLRECLIANLKLLIHLSYGYGSNQMMNRSNIGQKDGIIDTILYIFIKVPDYVPNEEKFEIMFSIINLLINLVGLCLEKKKLAKVPDTSRNDDLHDSVKSVEIEALVKLFFEQVELAKIGEILNGKIKQIKQPAKNARLKEHKRFIEEKIALFVEQAAPNMQHIMVASYIAILTGYITMDDQKYLKIVSKQLPDGRFVAMLMVLDKYLNFMKLTAAPGAKEIKSIEMIIKHFSKCEKLQAEASCLPGTSAQ